MEIIKERNLCKNILHWYPEHKDESVLQIGFVPEDIIQELYDKFKNVAIVVRNEVQKEEILKSFKDIKLYTNIDEIEKKYDYISLIGTLENYEIEGKAYQKLQKIISVALNYCNDNGEILLVVDNKYGMKSWTTLDAQKNILCNQTHAISKTMIEKIFGESGIKNYKYYYVLPDYKVPNVIFTDDYLPNVESINRNFLYGEEEFSNFNQTEAYIEILKENPQKFKFFANSYFIEIGKNELKQNDIRFVSYTNLRKDEYKIQTIIYKDRVEKTNITEKAKKHIENIKENIEYMNKKGINTLDRFENGKIISKYVENGKSYDKILLELLQNGEFNEFFDEINKYKVWILNKLEKIEYTDDNVFKKYNIQYQENIIKKLNFVKYGLWDFIFQNSFYIDGELYFYDQEWFEYNIPVEYIIYRAIAYFPIAHSYIKTEELYQKLNIYIYIDLFRELDAKLQEQIRDDEMWIQHNRTQTGQTLLNLYNNLLIELNEYKIRENNYKEQIESEVIEEKNELQMQVNNLLKEREIIRNSKSWKITKPLRWINRKIKRD